MTPDDSVRAAELALGLLEGAERAAALRQVLTDPAFAREVEAWRDRFAPLIGEVQEVAPEASAPRLPAPRGDTPWRWWAAAATLVAACLALFVLLRPPAAPPAPQVVVPVATPRLTAALSPTGAGPPFAAVYDAGSGDLRLAAGITVPSGRVAELWRIGGDGVPHALGLLARSGPSSVVLAAADRAALAPGTTLAVSIEPEGGSPTGKPTGPVVATGALAPV